MSGDGMDKKEFEFIKEQVIQKKRKKFRKWLIPFFMTIFMAILFGVVAAVTFCITEPRLYKLLHKEEEVKTPITFPTTYPEDHDSNETLGIEKKDTEAIVTKPADNPVGTEEISKPEQVIVNKVNANLEDYLSMSDEIRTLAYKANKSMITISSIVKGKDIFGNTSETKVNTTGLIIGKDEYDLYILVSLDRVSNASSVKLVLSESETVDAVLIDYEKEINLAVLTVRIENIPPLYMSNNVVVATLGESYTITLGSPVIAIGCPNGYPGSLDFGIITSRGSYINISDNKLDLFNTSIRDNKNADGVIINLKGEVIGLITRTLKEGLNNDLNTVIGISKVKSYIEKMVNKGPRIYCGIIAEDMTEEAKTKHEVQHGIYINDVQANSPAFEAGMKGGDIIMQIDDKNIMNTNSFYNVISSYKPGDVIKVIVKRTSSSVDKDVELKVTLTKKIQ